MFNLLEICLWRRIALIKRKVFIQHLIRILSRQETLRIFRIMFFGLFTFGSLKWMINNMDPTRKQKSEAQKKAKDLLKRNGIQNVKLSEYELSIASNLVVPSDISVSWENIGGLEDIIKEIQETVILPFKNSALFKNSSLLQPPKGVLLHGPPGCGKTLIAKAFAKEAGARFINIQVSSLTDKWYGESQKLAAAMFSVANKLQPCVIFFDEIDSFLRSRNNNDHEATAMMKAQFMSLWDGLATNTDCSIIIMGATNRPQDLDQAILRRMPSRFFIGLPNEIQRQSIIKVILDKEKVADDFDFTKIAEATDGFSGSDLKEICREAAITAVRKYLKQMELNKLDDSEKQKKIMSSLPPITMEDINEAVKKMKESRKSGSLSIPNSIGLD